MTKRGPHNFAITWTPHIRVAWGGSLGIGKEVWTNAVRYIPATAGAQATPAQVQAAFPGVWTALRAWHGTANGSLIGNESLIKWVKINNVLATGLQAPGDTNLYDTGTPGSGSNANSVPFYQTYAITLRTSGSRGRAHAGRIFPPLVEPALEAQTGMCSAADATQMAAAFSTCLSGMETAMVFAGIPGGFVVMSPGDSTKGTAPIYHGITGCVVDRVPDVQHRRTNRLPRAEGTPSSFAGGVV